MPREEQIKESLINKFGFLKDRINIPRARRISVEVDAANFIPVFVFAAQDMTFNHLCTITGLDELENLSFIYHLAHDDGTLLNIKISAPKSKPVIKTVTPYFPGAEIYERELVDLLGAQVEGLAPGIRYPLTDDWPMDQHPLRKDWKAGSKTVKE